METEKIYHPEIENAKNAVEGLYNCDATFAESVEVHETFQGQTVWQGIVHIFNIQGHPKATRCYAWSSPIDGSANRRYYAVLHISPVDSPEKAVRASIVHDHKVREGI